MGKWTRTRRDPRRTYQSQGDESKAKAVRRAVESAREELPFLLDPMLNDDDAEQRYADALKRWLPDITDEQIKEKLKLFRGARLLRKGAG